MDLILEFVCGSCGKGFPKPFILSCHVINKHVKQEVVDPDFAPFECYMCKDKFMSLLGTRNHFKKNHPIIRDRKCMICQLQLSLHEQNEHWCIDEEQIDCEYCRKSFESITEALTHLDTHNEKKFYQCDKCKKFFPLKILMKNHAKHHIEKPKPFTCDICKKRYATKQQLKYHMRIHSAKSKFY